MSIRKKRDNKCDEKNDVLFIPLDQVSKLHDAYLSEMESEKVRLNTIRDADVIKLFYGTLIKSYNGAIALKSRECKVDYDIKTAEIRARADEQTPVRRRRWWWAFRPITNRAQDLIEERAELDAKRIHSDAEKQLDDDWRKYFPDTVVKPSKREVRRIARQLLKAAIKKADEIPTNEAFEEPAEPKEQETPKKFSIEEFERHLQELADDVKEKPFVEVWNNIKDRICPHKDEQESVENVEKQEAEQMDEPIKAAEPVQAQSEAAPVNDVKPMQEQSDEAAKQLPGQMTLDDVQAQENAEKPAQAQTTWTRPPRPPKSCRKR